MILKEIAHYHLNTCGCRVDDPDRWTYCNQHGGNGPVDQSKQMTFYTLRQSDIGKPQIRAFGRWYAVEEFIGQVLPKDVGKRVYQRGEIVQVENDEQRDQRVKGGQIGCLTAEIEHIVQAGGQIALPPQHAAQPGTWLHDVKDTPCESEQA